MNRSILFLLFLLLAAFLCTGTLGADTTLHGILTRSSSGASQSVSTPATVDPTTGNISTPGSITAGNGSTNGGSWTFTTASNINFTISPISALVSNTFVQLPEAFNGLVKWSTSTTGGSNVVTVSQAVVGTDYVGPATQTGTHASPSTSNPLSPTWTGALHTVWYGATGTINLPAVASYTGKAILIYNTGAFTITIDSNGSEVIVRDGTAQTGGVNFTLSSGAGNYVSLFCDGARWVTLGYKGTLTLGS
jgi:hypothetical protein